MKKNNGQVVIQSKEKENNEEQAKNNEFKSKPDLELALIPNWCEPHRQLWDPTLKLWISIPTKAKPGCNNEKPWPNVYKRHEPEV